MGNSLAQAAPKAAGNRVVDKPAIGGAERHLPSNLKANMHTGGLKSAIHGLDATGAAMVMFLCGSNRRVTFSLSKSHYLIPERYRSHLYTYARIRNAVNLLEGRGLVEVDRVRPSPNNTRQSSMVALPALREIWERVRSGKPEPSFSMKELIWLKTGPKKKKVLTDYSSNRKINTMRREVDDVNAMLQSADIQGCEVPFVVRIFTDDFDTHGRLYAIGNSWQNMRAENRQDIRIEGEPVVEDDYSGIHITMLYDMAGLPIPDNAFTFGEWPRELIKRAFYTLVNAETLSSAVGAIQHSDEMARHIGRVMASSGWVDIVDSKSVAVDLVQAIKERHKPVASRFHSGAGMELMYLDSNMAMDVISRLMDQGIVVLPVYDSFLVKKSKAAELRIAMIEAAKSMGFPSMRASRK